MPKDTFMNLPEEKKNRIIEVLKEEFKKKPVSEVNVKDIVSSLSIARGSFYQYFEDLYESYFMILETETVDVHSLFIKGLTKNKGDLYKALKDYGQAIADNIYDGASYMIYKNRYLYWNESLEKGWQAYLKKNLNGEKEKALSFKDGSLRADMEIVHFIKAVVHDLIQRIFKENLSKEEFLEKYQTHIRWIRKGVQDGNDRKPL